MCDGRFHSFDAEQGCAGGPGGGDAEESDPAVEVGDRIDIGRQCIDDSGAEQSGRFPVDLPEAVGADGEVAAVDLFGQGAVSAEHSQCGSGRMGATATTGTAAAATTTTMVLLRSGRLGEEGEGGRQPGVDLVEDLWRGPTTDDERTVVAGPREFETANAGRMECRDVEVVQGSGGQGRRGHGDDLV